MTDEQREKSNLENTVSKIKSAISDINERINSQLDDIKTAKVHMEEHKRDMDHLEKNAVREAVGQIAMLGEATVAKRK
ncbi:MAG: hypothetical protein LC664_07670, partial [Flavobacteriales bacterium]|nr:hypothetical protein [Flavobacteriales bacterium]